MNKFESITNPLMWFMALLLVALAAGCGGGGDSGSNIITGVASKGPLNGSTVCAYAISGGVKGAQIGSCSTTDSASNGNYSINLGSYTGPVLLEATGGNYVDEATAATVPLASPLRSMLLNTTGVTTRVAVTPLTELAYQIADATAGGLNSINIQTAINKVQSDFGVADIVNTMPVDALVPDGATPAQETYTLALATISQYMKTSGTPLATALGVIQASSASSSVGTLLGSDMATFVSGRLAFPASSAKAITAYSLAGATGTINETAKTIAVTVPFGTNVTALVATFTTTGAGVPTVGGVNQISGTTANDFTTSKAYTVTAGDSSTATYTVTVTVAPSSAKAITAYSLAGATGTINETAKTIAVTVPFGTNVTALVATFTTTGAGAPTVGGVDQISGTTANDFTTSKAYIVTAADTTTATYTVTVTVAPSSAKVITAYSFAVYPGATGAIDETAKTIAVTVPFGTNVTALVATFTTTGAGAPTVGGVSQISGTTANDFTTSKDYIVTAADSSTATYTVTVTVSVSATANPTAPNLGEAGRYVILASQAVTTTVGSVISNGDIGIIDIARTGIAGFTATGPAGDFTELTNGTSYAPDDANPAPFPYPLKSATLVVGDPWATTGTMITQVRTDLGIANTFLAADPNPSAPTQIAPIELGNLILTRGVYRNAANIAITTGPLHLDAQGDPNSVFIIVTDGTLTTGASGSIVLDNGALAKNVYWSSAGITTIAAGTIFYGNVFAGTQVNVLAGANVTGRLFGVTGQVTLISNIVTKAP